MPTLPADPAEAGPEVESVAFVSLGCAKNLVDSERMLGLLAADGIAITPDASDADAIVINTCGFLEASKQESLAEINAAVELKKTGRVKRVVVAGCLVQRHKAKLLAEAPGIDRLVGVFDRDHIVEAVRGGLGREQGHFLGRYHALTSDTEAAQRDIAGAQRGIAGAQRDDARPHHDAAAPQHDDARPQSGDEGLHQSAAAAQGGMAGGETAVAAAPAAGLPDVHQSNALDLLQRQAAGKRGRRLPTFEDDRGRFRLTPRHFAYLRMSEGCNQGCAFCTIPSIRGPMRSKPIEQIMAEARELASDGAIELLLIGQDTTSYGTDIGYTGPGRGLAGLLRTLDRDLPRDVAWIRLMYAYPSCFTDEMIDALASCRRVVPYVDMPLQHINDDVLARMKRKVTSEQTITLLDKLRARVPNLALRTTFITGSPGETEAEHEELVDFVRQGYFEHMGVFPYSPEPGTPMGRMAGQVDEATKQRRLEELMLAQQEVVFARNAARVGETVEALIDGPHTEPGTYLARTRGQAPEIDSVTFVASAQPLHAGQIVDVTVTDYQHYDLVAELPRPTRRALAVLAG